MIRAAVGLILGLPGLLHALLFFFGAGLGHLVLTHPDSPAVSILIQPFVVRGLSPFDLDIYPQGIWALVGFQIVFLLLFIILVGLFSLIVFALFAGITSLFVRMVRLRTTLDQVVVGYLEVALIFAGLYYVISVFYSGAITGMSDMQSWSDYQSSDMKGQLLSDIGLRWADCLHYSVVTQTTLGFGDMLPKTVTTKLLTDVQALIGLFFIAVGIGQRVAK